MPRFEVRDPKGRGVGDSQHVENSLRGGCLSPKQKSKARKGEHGNDRNDMPAGEEPTPCSGHKLCDELPGVLGHVGEPHPQ